MSTKPMNSEHINSETALAHLAQIGDPDKAAQLAQHHGVKRPYLGIAIPVLDSLAKEWRGDDLDARLELARSLWDSNIFEARITAAKLLTQARLRPDDSAAWELITTWLPDIDCVAIADHVATAGQKRIIWDASRVNELGQWISSGHTWTRRAVLTFTAPWTKQSRTKPADIAMRDQILDWAAQHYVEDHDPLVQRALAWWLRDLSRHNAPIVQAFLEKNGERMTRSARREAAQMIKREAKSLKQSASPDQSDPDSTPA